MINRPYKGIKCDPEINKNKKGVDSMSKSQRSLSCNQYLVDSSSPSTSSSRKHVSDSFEKKSSTSIENVGKRKIIDTDDNVSKQISDNISESLKDSSKQIDIPRSYLSEKNDDNVNSCFNQDHYVAQIDQPDVVEKLCTDVYIVLDTNILMSGYGIIDLLRSRMTYGKLMKIVIPYVVLMELDRLKIKTSQKKKAKKAINWINSYLVKNEENIIGQTHEDYILSKSESDNESGDDLILSCCLSYMENRKIVFLISNDVNLRNRALVSKINSCDAKNLESIIVKQRKKLKPKKKRNPNCEVSQVPRLSQVPPLSQVTHEIGPVENKITKIPEDLLSLESFIVKRLGGVLRHAMVDAYDEIWTQIVLYKPPWSAVQVLKCFEKHWIAVFIDKFSNDVLDIIKDIHKCLVHKHIHDVPKKLSLLFTLFKKDPYKSIVNSYGSKPQQSTESCDSKKPPLPQLSHHSTSPPLMETEEKSYEFTHIKDSILFVGRRSCQVILSYNLDQNVEDINLCSSLPNGTMSELRSHLVSFGFLLISLKDGNIESPGAPFDDSLKKFYDMTGCRFSAPKFTDIQLKVFASCSEGMEFLQCCIADFETVIQAIDSAGAFKRTQQS